MNDFDRQHIGDIIAGRDPETFSYFTAQLLRLIAKADYINRELLHRVYPHEVEAYEDWWHETGRATAEEQVAD